MTLSSTLITEGHVVASPAMLAKVSPTYLDNTLKVETDDNGLAKPVEPVTVLRGTFTIWDYTPKQLDNISKNWSYIIQAIDEAAENFHDWE